MASSAGFPSLLDPSSGYTGGSGSAHGLALPPPMGANPGRNSGSSFSQPSRSAYAPKPLGPKGPKPVGGRSPRRGPRTAPRGGRSQWDRPLARSWDRPLARSRMYKSIDSTSSNGGGEWALSGVCAKLLPALVALDTRLGAGGPAGLKWRRPFLRTASHSPPGLLWRLRAGLSNPKLPPSGSDHKEAAGKAAGDSPQNEPSPFSTNRRGGGASRRARASCRRSSRRP